MATMNEQIREALQKGIAIPASPLALNANRKLDERRQRALSRYYYAAGAGGIAVGVHTTQFAIREPEHGLFRPVLELAADAIRSARAAHDRPFVMVAGLAGTTSAAVAEAEAALTYGYDVGLLSLAALTSASNTELLDHCRAIAD